MNILFLNHTFPGPFQHLAAAFGAMPEHTVLFAAERGRRDFSLPGVRRVVLARPKDRSPLRTSTPTDLEKIESDLHMACLRGRTTASSFQKLRNTGFVPHMLIASASKGNSLFARSVFPEAFVVAYADWYVSRSNPNAPSASSKLRNGFQLSTLLDSDLTYTSTLWQKQQFPEIIAQNMRVIPLCVESTVFAPDPNARFHAEGCDLSSAAEVLTVWGGGMNLSRQFSLLLKSLPLFMHVRPQCHTVILAGPNSPVVQEALQKAPWFEPHHADRVHVLSYLPTDAYITLLQASTLFVYPCAPTMLSPAILEAMSCGCPVLAGDSEAVREVLHNGKNGYLFASADADVMAIGMARLLESPQNMAAVRQAARRTIQACARPENITVAARELLQACKARNAQQ